MPESDPQWTDADSVTETVQHRVIGVHPEGGSPRTFDDELISRVGLRTLLYHLDTAGYREVRVETRTVRTRTGPWTRAAATSASTTGPVR